MTFLGKMEIGEEEIFPLEADSLRLHVYVC